MVIVSSKQPHGNIQEIARPELPDEESILNGADLTRYDALLAMIPVALLAGWVAGHVASVPQWAAIGVGALVAIPALIDGLFLNPPA